MKTKIKRRKSHPGKPKTARSRPITTIHEFEKIVEFCYNQKQGKFVVRFLDGSSYALKVTDLPPKLRTKKPQWPDSFLSDDHRSIIVPSVKAQKVIESHIIHARGKVL